MNGVDLSVIIPTYNRKGSLLNTLAGLCHQDHPMGRFDVVVVDDGSTDDTGEIARLQFPFSVIYLRQDNLGEIAARELGVAHAQGNALTFLDDDMLVCPQYIGALMRAHQGYPEHLIVGSVDTRYIPSDTMPMALPTFSEAVAPTYDVQEIPYIEVCSHSLLVSKPTFSAVGGMRPLDNSGRNAWGGIDLGFRAHSLGYRVYRAKSAVAIHNDRGLRSFRANSQRWERVCALAVLLLQRYPDLRGRIPMLRDKEEIDWDKDGLRLIGKKLAKRILALPGLTELIDLIAIASSSTPWCDRICTWGMEPHMIRGYRKGLKQYGSARRWVTASASSLNTGSRNANTD